MNSTVCLLANPTHTKSHSKGHKTGSSGDSSGPLLSKEGVVPGPKETTTEGGPSRQGLHFSPSASVVKPGRLVVEQTWLIVLGYLEMIIATTLASRIILTN